MSACRNAVVAGEICGQRQEDLERVCNTVNDDMKLLGLQPEWALFRDMWRGFILRQTSIINPERGRN